MSESIQREDNDTDPHLIILNWLTIASDEDERQEASQDSHSMYVIHVFGMGGCVSVSLPGLHKVSEHRERSLLITELIHSCIPA